MKTILSGVTSTNKLQLGNYLGALKNWTAIQNQYRCYFFAADLHALTVRQDPKNLYAQTFENLACYLAAGIDPQKATLFIQSEVPEHAELSWILTCHTSMGELSRMTQFKDKSEKETTIQAGLLTYPVLMAADILLYQADLVPVGADQKQHLELTRDIASRMNRLYAPQELPLFTIPEPFIPKIGARIMDLQNPEKKMSKSSENEAGTIYLTDPPKEIEKKFKRAVTDSGTEILYDDSKLGVKNLIEIQSTLTGKRPDEIVQDYVGKQYGHLKLATAELVIAELAIFQKKLADFLSDQTELRCILGRGRDAAREKAGQTLTTVKKALGLSR